MGYPGIETYYYGPNLHKYLNEVRTKAFDLHGAFSVGETPGIGMNMCRFVTGEEVSSVGTNFNQQWYENICTQVETKRASEIDACYPSVKADVDKRVDAFFEESIYTLIDIANMTPVACDDEGYMVFEEEVDALYQVVLTALLGR